MFGSAFDVLIVLILFGLAVFVHELGHFLVARRCGMIVDVFSIGFGPALWKTRRNGITYKIGWIPFGGYVSLPQLDPSAMAAVQGKEKGSGEDKPVRDLPPAPAGKKILVSMAGALGNLVLAFVLAWVVFLAGKIVGSPASRGGLVGYVETNSVAYARGLRAGDEIVSVNGEPVKTWQNLLQLAALSAAPVLDVKSGGQVRKIRVPTESDPFGITGVQGIEPSSVCRVLGVQAGWSAAKAGVKGGDVIVAFDGIKIGGSRHLIDLVNECAGRAVSMAVDRGGQTVEMQVTPQPDPTTGRARIGIQFDTIGLQFDEMAQKTPWEQIKYDSTAIVRMLQALVTPKEAKRAAEGIGGPTMIIATLWVVVKIGLLSAISFARFLNVNLAILNLLPIPVLDGGHIMFAAWEGITRRKVKPAFVNALTNIFAVIFIALFLFLTWRDIDRLASIRRFLAADARTNAVPAKVTNSLPPSATGGAR